VGLNHDFLAELASKEASITDGAFTSLKTAAVCGINGGTISADSYTNILDLATGTKHCDYAVAYVATIIESPRDQDVVIAAGADDNLKIWLNHEELVADPVVVHRFIKKFGHVTGGRLKKGNNFLLVKVGNLTGDWRLIVTLFPHARAVELAEGNAINPILVNSVIPPSEPVKLRTDLLPSVRDAKAEIIDASHSVIDSWKLRAERITTRDIAKFEKNRVYFCRLTSAGHVIERPFYYGDLEAGFARLAERVGQVTPNDDLVRIALQAQSARLKHLLKPESESSEAWQQKVAAGYAELEANLALVDQGAVAFRHAPGTHLRGYRSSVDGQVLNYWIHVPERAAERSGKPIPLVVVLPWTALENLPFLESSQIASFEEAERYRILGDEFQFGVLQVWGRGKNLGGTAIWNADVFEALDAVSRDYSIDQNRIYLVGDCEGGRQALLLGERYPNRFAAIAVEGPISIFESRAWRFAPWIQYSSPIVSVANLVSTPVFISHEVNGEPPAQESELFVNKARAAGVDATLVRTTRGFHGFSQDPMGVKRSLFVFFTGKQRTNLPNKVAAEREAPHFGAGQGPIEDAFGAPVLVVEGTVGSSDQRAAVHALSEEVLAEWQRSYFVDCPHKPDLDVAASDLEKYNLVLVGDRDTNTLIQQLGDGLPITATAEKVSVAGRTYQGSQLGYEFIFRNPLNRGKYVVIIGMNQWGPLKGWRVHPSKDGISDYIIFDLQGPSPRLRDAGYYDSADWEKSQNSQDGQGSRTVSAVQ
jgi:pimeloyl-ACP methyl ester carboxylesterase